MQRYRISSSTQIYIEQIDNYIQTGEGYKQLRVLLLKQLNEMDSENHNADETFDQQGAHNYGRFEEEFVSGQLIAKVKNHRCTCLLYRLNQVLQDVITYADQIVQSYVISEPYCITMSTVISYKLFNPFTKAIFDENKLRLISILMYYQNKFKTNQNKYYYICKTVKELKEKGFIFPERTYIIVPKVNQFKKKFVKKDEEKSADSDRVGVTFQSIVEFVKDCQKQFNNNKNSCANTQFVRALKVKAKTLYDFSQNTQGLDLKPKEKQHAKQLYKQIRTMLKQIEKISEQKIKQQKIKNEKQFAEGKIQNMTPKKEKQSAIRQKQVETSDLLGNVIIPANEKVKTPSSMKKVSSLLDDTNNDEFSDFVSANVTEKSIKKSVSSPFKEDGPKPLKKPPKYDELIKNESLIPTNGNLIETVQQSVINSQKKVSQKQQSSQLIETFTQQLPYSKKSIHSQHSEKGVKLIEEADLMSPNNNNVVDFQNQQHFSRFQVVNTLASKIMDNNAYNVIPHDIDFSDSSSQSGNRVTFQVNKDQHFFDEQHINKPYDKGYLTPKKQQSQHERVSQHVAKSQKDIEKLSSSENYQKQTQQQQQLVANVDFGILADMRQVKAYDYSNVHLEKSVSNISEEEQKRIQLTPQSIKPPRNPQQAHQLSPNDMIFNCQQNKEKHQQLNIDKDEDEFEQYQQLEQTFSVKQIKKQSLIDKIVSKLQQNDEELLKEQSPQKGGLMNIGLSPTSKHEPLL